MEILGSQDTLQAFSQILHSQSGLLLIGLILAGGALEILLPSRRARRRRHNSAQWKWPWTRRAHSLEELSTLSADEFESFVAGLFRKRGYQAKVIGGQGDHGVDIVVTNLQGERELVQCKRWERKWLGEGVVRDFYGALVHDGRAVQGHIVTTSFFSNAARRWAHGKPIDLVDGNKLAAAIRALRGS